MSDFSVASRHLLCPRKNGAGDGFGDGAGELQLLPARRDDRVSPPRAIAIAPRGRLSLGTLGICPSDELAALVPAPPAAAEPAADRSSLAASGLLAGKHSAALPPAACTALLH
jgi:hypothetical protein